MLWKGQEATSCFIILMKKTKDTSMHPSGSLFAALDLKHLKRNELSMMPWLKTRPLRQEQKLDPVVLLMSPNNLVDDIDVNR